MIFLCDAMLGGLAKWLRAAGYDTYYAREGTDIDDRALTEKALREGRVLLTGDRGFLERVPVRDGRLKLLLLPHLPVEEQLRAVVERFELTPRPSRCMECNGKLETVPFEEIADRVPLGVARQRREFWRCRNCWRVFWHGSHWARISGRLERVFS
ncbi:MAG: Mut7-C RNAse domain-containing protein [Actinomycetota bacterium]|nr:Mut7-C RNAse domain-containing protein [Actinomycetota bacterium]